MRLSICIPAYNAENQIARCLKSIASQDYSDYEVVIVDDGSTKQLELDIDMVGVCCNSVLSRTRIIRQSNAGPYAARQMAVENARGDYCFFMDADDMLAHPSVLRRVAAVLDNTCPDVVFFNAAREDGMPFVDYSNLKLKEIITRDCVVRELISNGWWNSLFCMVFRRGLFVPRPDRPRLVMAEDRLQKAEILTKAHTFALIDEVLYIYLTVPTSITNAGFKPSYFADLSYVEHEVRAQCWQYANLEEREWANAYLLRVVLWSLFQVRQETSFDFKQRVALYCTIRKDFGYENSLRLFERRDWSIKDRLCLCALRKRRMVLLDVLLAGRMLGANVKRLIKKRSELLRKI